MEIEYELIDNGVLLTDNDYEQLVPIFNNENGIQNKEVEEVLGYWLHDEIKKVIGHLIIDKVKITIDIKPIN